MVSAFWPWSLQEFVTETRPTGREQERSNERSQEVRDDILDLMMECACAQIATVVSEVEDKLLLLWLCSGQYVDPCPHPDLASKVTFTHITYACRWLVPTRVWWMSKSVTPALVFLPQVSP